MGASDSKLVFKKGIFRLSEERDIAADDPYWTSFWELPESTEDVFSLFSPVDIRRTRDSSHENIETLLLAVTSRLFVLRHHPSFPNPEVAPERDALNCIRVLTRLLPFLYEVEQLEEWEEKFFWTTRRRRNRKALTREVLFDEAQEGLPPAKPQDEFEEAKPLAEELIDTLIDLLFFADFTLPRPPQGKNKVTYAIWQSGVGCNTSVGTSKEFESNRCEVLRLLLTLTSKSMYMSPTLLPVQGVKAITYIATCPDKQVVLSVLCSLLNTSLKYNPASWRVSYNHMFKDPKQILVTYTLQFLLVILLYPIPEAGPANMQKNYYRHFLGRLHRPSDFQFIVDGMMRILNQPIMAHTSYIPGNNAATKCAPEMIMLFWEITQSNKRFRSFIIDTNRSHDFIVLLLFFVLEYKADPSKQGVVRMCAFLLQTLSVENNFGSSLNKMFEGQDALPPSICIPGFRGTYADFLIHSIYNIITSSQGRLSAIYPALLAVINNIAAYVQGLSVSTSSKILHLYSSMAAPSFLLANDSNHSLLHSLLESMNAIIEHQYKENPNFVFVIIRNGRRFEALRTFTLESGQEEIEQRNRRRKEQGQNAADGDGLSRRSSVDSVWSPSSSHPRGSTLSNVPEEESAFAIGDDDEEDTDDESHDARASSTTESHSRPSSIASSQLDDAVPVQLRGMSEKARGKMPAGTPVFSRQNSTTSLGGYAPGATGAFEPSAQWIETWLPELPLLTILNVIEQLAPTVPRSAVTPEAMPKIIQTIRDAHILGIEPAPIRVHSFEWSPLALGWYESLLWSFVFSSEMQVSKGTAGVWNGTMIRLFRVQETAAEGPTLTSPRGAVDAVGSNIVSRIGSINLRGGPPANNRDASQGNAPAAGARGGTRSAVV